MVGKLLLMLTCALPFALLLRTTSIARPFHVVTRGEVEGSLSFISAEAKASKLPCPLVMASQEMAASGQTLPLRSTTSTVIKVSPVALWLLRFVPSLQPEQWLYLLLPLELLQRHHSLQYAWQAWFEATRDDRCPSRSTIYSWAVRYCSPSPTLHSLDYFYTDKVLCRW